MLETSWNCLLSSLPDWLPMHPKSVTRFLPGLLIVSRVTDLGKEFFDGFFGEFNSLDLGLALERDLICSPDIGYFYCIFRVSWVLIGFIIAREYFIPNCSLIYRLVLYFLNSPREYFIKAWYRMEWFVIIQVIKNGYLRTIIRYWV